MSETALMQRLKKPVSWPNTSGRHPKGRAVLVLPYEPELNKPGSTILIPPQVREKNQMLENRARVIEVGAACWIDEPEPRAKVGDIVLVTRFAGFMTLGDDGVLYKLINDKDLFSTCDERPGEGVAS